MKQQAWQEQAESLLPCSSSLGQVRQMAQPKAALLQLSMTVGASYLHGAQAVQAGYEGGEDDGARREAQACSHQTKTCLLSNCG